MGHNARYTKQEDEHIRILFSQKKSDEKIAEIIGRTVISVQYRRRKLNLFRPDAIAITMKSAKHWTRAELEFINNYWMLKTDRWMAAKLGVTIIQYKKRRQRLGHFKTWEQKKGRKRTWHVVEEHFLIDNYKDHSAKWIGDKLGRSENAIQYKAKRMGLKKSFIPGRRGYDNERLNYYAK